MRETEMRDLGMRDLGFQIGEPSEARPGKAGQRKERSTISHQRRGVVTGRKNDVGFYPSRKFLAWVFLLLGASNSFSK